MNNEYIPSLDLVLKYNTLFNRFLMRLTAGNQELTDDIIKHAMEEVYTENKFHDTPELRKLLHEKVVSRLLASGYARNAS